MGIPMIGSLGLGGDVMTRLIRDNARTRTSVLDLRHDAVRVRDLERGARRHEAAEQRRLMSGARAESRDERERYV